MQEDHEMFRALADTMAAATFIYRGRGFLYVNPAATELTGYSRAELLAREFWDVVHPDHREMIRERGLARQRGEAVEPRYEFKIVTRTGEVRWVDFTAGVIHYQGKTAALGTAFDITARKVAEEGVRERGQAVALLQRVSAAANQAGSLHEVLDACLRDICEFGGWAVGLVHRLESGGSLQPYPLWYAREADRFAGFREVAMGSDAGGLVEQALRSGEPVVTANLLEGPDPALAAEAERCGLRSAVAVPVLVRDRACAVLQFFCERDGTALSRTLEVLSDVCTQIGRVIEREEAEQAIRRSEAHYRTLTERISDVILVLSPELYVRYVTPSVRRILGYPPEGMLGRDGMAFVHPDDHEEVRRRVEERLRGGRATTAVEVRLRHRDGSFRTFGVLSDPIPGPDGPAGLVVTAHDLSERKQLEEQLRHVQKMDAVGRLAGGVAHDFNNLLTAILGNTELLLLDLPEADPSRVEVEEIREAAERAASLTRQLLAFARRQVLQFEVVRLDAIAAGMEKMLRRLIGSEIELVTYAEADAGLVRVDPRQIEQVVLNLVVNARDAMADGGTVVLRTENVELDRTRARALGGIPPGWYVRLAVEDTGCGMDRATLARAFEPFFTTKEQGRGTGLGLSMVYGIVQQSGGHVHVESRVGQGTTVAVYLPRVEEGPPPAAADPEPVEEAERPGTETVLLVDDQAQVLSMAHRLLTRAGYRVLDASGGEQALRLFHENADQIDMVVTDMRMPGMNGQQVLEACRTLRPDLPAILMSGHTSAPAVQEYLRVSGTPFLQKPFTPAGLTRLVRETLRSSPGRAGDAAS